MGRGWEVGRGSIQKQSRVKVKLFTNAILENFCLSQENSRKLEFKQEAARHNIKGWYFLCQCPAPDSPYGLCGRKATLNWNFASSELWSCVTVEVAVLGFPSLRSLLVSVDVKQHWTDFHGLCGRKATLNWNFASSELWSCVTVEVAVLGFPSLRSLLVSVDVKQHWTDFFQWRHTSYDVLGGWERVKMLLFSGITAGIRASCLPLTMMSPRNSHGGGEGGGGVQGLNTGELGHLCVQPVPIIVTGESQILKYSIKPTEKFQKKIRPRKVPPPPKSLMEIFLNRKSFISASSVWWTEHVLRSLVLLKRHWLVVILLLSSIIFIMKV